jgi:REP element-mobilizing transposase RayT
MNRGIEGKKIFPDGRAKSYFLAALAEKATRLRIRLFAYCVMDTHYHIILQNSSGRLSEFMKQLDGQYGMYYRKREGGKGYVFQSRFESTLIQHDAYMDVAIVYVLLNPVRGGILKDPWKYPWSSIGGYFSGKGSDYLDKEFVEELFKDAKTLRSLIREWADRDMPVKNTRVGDVLGDEDFVKRALQRFDRRKRAEKSRRRRRFEFELEPVDGLIRDFEKRNDVKLGGIDTRTEKGRLLRDELLILLRDMAGLTYSQVLDYEPFKFLKQSSLGQTYKRAKGRGRRDGLSNVKHRPRT